MSSYLSTSLAPNQDRLNWFTPIIIQEKAKVEASLLKIIQDIELIQESIQRKMEEKRHLLVGEGSYDRGKSETIQLDIENLNTEVKLKRQDIGFLEYKIRIAEIALEKLERKS